MNSEQSIAVEPLLVSVNEAARILGFSRTRLYRHVREGNLKVTRDGGRTFFTMKELRRFVEKRENDTR
jgi:excisionase family DNA binding protein